MFQRVMKWSKVVLFRWLHIRSSSPSSANTLAARRASFKRVVTSSLLLAACGLAACEKSVPAEAVAHEDTAAVAAPAPKPAGLQTAELMVEGTSCASCAVTIRRHLHQLQGIGDIREGTTKQHLLVDFDPKLVTTEQLVKAVSDAGYEAEVLVHGASAPSVRQHGG